MTEKLITIIPQHMALIGELTGRGEIRLEGRVEGGCKVEGALTLAPGAHCQGNIIADVVIIEGTLNGAVVASRQLVLTATARVTGKLYSSNIQIEQGAKITGVVYMRDLAPEALTQNPSKYNSFVLYKPDFTKRSNHHITNI